MSTYSNRLQPALQNLLQRVVPFFHPWSSCTTTHISEDLQRITLNVLCMTISGGRTNKQFNIFCRVTGFTSDFLFHSFGTYSVLSRGAIQLFYIILVQQYDYMFKLMQVTVTNCLLLIASVSFFNCRICPRDNSTLGWVPHRSRFSGDSWCKIFTGRMPFLSPNQQCQRTDKLLDV